MPLITMYDSSDPAVILNLVPASAQAVAGYIGPVAPDNRYVTFDAVLKRFANKAHCLSIAVQAHIDAQCLDMEAGDASAQDFPAWYDRQKRRGVALPWGYGNQDTLDQVDALMRARGLKPGKDYIRWMAAYPGTGANVPAGDDAHQYSDHGPNGENYDLSVCNDYCFPTVVQDPNHYLWFYPGPFRVGKLLLNEQALVEAYDKYRALQTPTSHPSRAKLAVIRAQLRLLAGRVAAAAFADRIGGKPSWGKFSRGYRYQGLIRRSQGHLFVNGQDKG